MVLHGTPVSAGIATGKAFLYRPVEITVDKTPVQAAQSAQEIAYFYAAREAAGAELAALCEKLAADPEKAKIFTAHKDILFDVAMSEEIEEKINEELYSAEWAVDKIFTKYAKILSRAKDELIRERAADIQDVRSRLLRCCKGQPEFSLGALSEAVIVVAEDLFPSDTAAMDPALVLGIITEVGGPTSHTAIIARSYEIPAVLGVADAMTQLQEGQTLALDAVSGEVVAGPDEATLARYADKAAEHARKSAETKAYLDTEPRTPDGVRVEVELNIASASAAELRGAAYTDGVGLFRTEFLYMGRDELPGEDEQVRIYQNVLREFGQKPVVLRTMDIGGDKQLACLNLPAEPNPFLGNRALRLCLSQPEVFHTQLRAALRSAASGNLWIMFPMVGSLEDIEAARAALQRAEQSLGADGIPFGRQYKVGVMVEIPSLALMADKVAQVVDFVSIGTNDLTQYTLAVDRMNASVQSYYQSYHPAVFRLIRMVTQAMDAAGKPVGVCGELGGDPLAASVLLGLGVRRLSMGLASVAGVKKLVRSTGIVQMQALAAAVCEMATAAEVEAYLAQELRTIL